jgi:hypothetical protein
MLGTIDISSTRLILNLLSKKAQIKANEIISERLNDDHSQGFKAGMKWLLWEAKAIMNELEGREPGTKDKPSLKSAGRHAVGVG